MKFGNLATLNGKIAIEEITKTNNIMLIYFSEHSTPLCTKQLLSFKEEFETINKYDIVTYAVSTDSIENICTFEKKLRGLPFEIASDKNGSIAKT